MPVFPNVSTVIDPIEDNVTTPDEPEDKLKLSLLSVPPENTTSIKYDTLEFEVNLPISKDFIEESCTEIIPLFAFKLELDKFAVD